MNNIENLVIDNYPKLDESIIKTEHFIDSEQEISISINNSNILDKSDIIKIFNNCIELSEDIEINNNDSIVVIYNKLI
jgi:hypothetical protein